MYEEKYEKNVNEVIDLSCKNFYCKEAVAEN
jgi:hypothetical protein